MAINKPKVKFSDDDDDDYPKQPSKKSKDDEDDEPKSKKSKEEDEEDDEKKSKDEVMTFRGTAIKTSTGQLKIEEELGEGNDPGNAIEVAPKLAKTDMVTIVMLKEIDPAPVIGHEAHGGFNFVSHGITKLEDRKNYRVPKNVANVLVDKRYASIIALD